MREPDQAPSAVLVRAKRRLMLQRLYRIRESSPLLRLIAIERPVIYQGLT
jgi:hypothetical protein